MQLQKMKKYPRRTGSINQKRKTKHKEKRFKMIFAKFQNPKLPKTVFVEKQFVRLEDFERFKKSAEKYGTKCIEFYDTKRNEIKREA